MSRLRPLIFIVFLLLGALPAQNHAQAQLRADTQELKLNFAISNVCLPVIAYHVPFAQILVRYHLNEYVNCDVQECVTRYCLPGINQLCIVRPSKTCGISLTGDGDFAKLADVSVALLQASGRRWHEVANRGAPYEKALCDSSGELAVRLSGFHEGDVIGQLPKPLSGAGAGVTLRARSTSFVVSVSAATPSQCSGG